MRVLICGDRDWTKQNFDPLQVIPTFLEGLWYVGQSLNSPLTVISGMAPGADIQAAKWARESEVPLLPFPAKWKTHGVAAGPIRNTQMLREGQPDYVIAFHDDIANSKGTKDMLLQTMDKGVSAYLVSRVVRRGVR